MTDMEQRKSAKEFAKFWKGKGYEKGESQIFWINLLRDVYGVEKPQEYIIFEDQVHLDHTSFIDGSIATTHVLIEQKSLDKDLKKSIKQSDGSLLTPFQQAKRYAAELPYSQRPRWIVTCNFGGFLIYDMEKPTGEPEEILLEDLPTEYYRLQFLVDTTDNSIKKEMKISIQAGELVGRLYEAFLAEYNDPTNDHSLRSLNMLCVRLVFCLYAEDAGIFGRHAMFHDYLKNAGIKNGRRALIDLFRVLDTQPHDRDPYMDAELAAFPYVNGGLFSDEAIEIPQLNLDILTLLLSNASEDFDWSAISPTIFGAVFESTLNPETRRKGGMHYTSIENIHKVIDPLFLYDLKKELAAIKSIAVERTRKQQLKTFQAKLAELKFLDPACGSGNFLTETYISLRRLENETIRELLDLRKGRTASAGQITLELDGDIKPIRVSISQFFGIEINDFAVTVGKTALWIAESQMMKETEDIVHMNLDFLPLKSYTNIVEGNALRVDWETVVPKEKLNYIMGNPPFVGARLMNEAQKEDMESVFANLKNVGNLDYVSGWYEKAAEVVKDSDVRAALVSTNSITQGEQVPILWNRLFEKGVQITFAHRTFRWDSEAKMKAHVHCVIIGFANGNKPIPKMLFTADRYQTAKNINAYLLEGPNILIDSRKKPICPVPPVTFGSMPNDDGYLCDYTEEKRAEITAAYPSAISMFRPFLGATEFLHGKSRWCLWLKDISPAEIKKVPPVMEAIIAVKKMRESSKREATRKLAQTPYLFGEDRQPDTQYIIIPRHSSENRVYIPMGFVDPDIICGDSNLLIPNATHYEFGVLMSDVHNAWMRTVCGRLEMRYRYSANIVYNNFPWPSPTEDQKAAIEKTARAILDARSLYPNLTLADLYEGTLMKSKLLKAHKQNNRAVMEAYGFNVKETTETTIVAALMERYAELAQKKN